MRCPAVLHERARHVNEGHVTAACRLLLVPALQPQMQCSSQLLAARPAEQPGFCPRTFLRVRPRTWDMASMQACTWTTRCSLGASSPSSHAGACVPVPAGVSLIELVANNKGRLPEPFCASEVAIPLLQTMAALHAHGCVHRNLKPEHVVCGAGCSVRLIDFTEAANRRVRCLNDRTGAMEYSAPEVLVKPTTSEVFHKVRRGQHGQAHVQAHACMHAAAAWWWQRRGQRACLCALLCRCSVHARNAFGARAKSACCKAHEPLAMLWCEAWKEGARKVCTGLDIFSLQLAVAAGQAPHTC